MITDSDGNKITAKTKAQDIIMLAIANMRGYWTETFDDEIINLSEKEIRSISVQLEKLSDRIAKMCGYDKSWTA